MAPKKSQASASSKHTKPAPKSKRDKKTAASATDDQNTEKKNKETAAPKQSKAKATEINTVPATDSDAQKEAKTAKRAKTVQNRTKTDDIGTDRELDVGVDTKQTDESAQKQHGSNSNADASVPEKDAQITAESKSVSTIAAFFSVENEQAKTQPGLAVRILLQMLWARRR